MRKKASGQQYCIYVTVNGLFVITSDVTCDNVTCTAAIRSSVVA